MEKSQGGPVTEPPPVDDALPPKIAGAGLLGVLVLVTLLAITVPVLISVLIVARFLPFGAYATDPGVGRVLVPMVILLTGLVLQPLFKIFLGLALFSWRHTAWPDRIAGVLDVAYDALFMYAICAYLLDTLPAALTATLLAFALYAALDACLNTLWPEHFATGSKLPGPAGRRPLRRR